MYSYEVDQPKRPKRVEFEGIELVVRQPVYCPREDSFLLARAVKQLAPGTVLDMGTGSGLQAICAARNQNVTSVLAVDASAPAIECAGENAERNKVGKKITFLQSDLFDKVKGRFDTIIFNPPYLPVEKVELRDAESMAWHGGKTGRSILEPFLDQFPSHLASNGQLLLLQSSLNGPVKTKRKLEKMGFEVKVISSESFFFEKIYAYRATI